LLLVIGSVASLAANVAVAEPSRQEMPPGSGSSTSTTPARSRPSAAPQPAASGNTFPLFAHYGVSLWVTEVGGPIDPATATEVALARLLNDLVHPPSMKDFDRYLERSGVIVIPGE
jgi:hypothetical protein